MRERDLFRAIVLSGTALVAGCPSTPAGTDSGVDAPTLPADAPIAADAPADGGVLVADAGDDAPTPVDAGSDEDAPDGMVLIL